MDAYALIIFFCIVIIASYLFDLVAVKFKMPSVLLLLATGVGLKYGAQWLNYPAFDFSLVLPILGTLGLILIVLEGALELEFTDEKLPVIRKAFLSALVILLVTNAGIAIVLYYLTGSGFQACLVNAVPYSVISSAIAIPSAGVLANKDKEFIIYESSFSDILGVMLFNYVTITGSAAGPELAIHLVRELLIIGVISVVFCLLLLYLLGITQHGAKFFLLIAILILVYAVGKSYHLSTLIIILAVGFFLNNAELIKYEKFRQYFLYPELKHDLHQFTVISRETAFLLRTFFFIIFGYTINVEALNDKLVLMYGSIAVAIIYLVRFIYLTFGARVPLMPQLFITPRGLISILIFLSIPNVFKIEGVGNEMLFFVVLFTVVAMAAGIMFTRREKA